LAHRVS